MKRAVSVCVAILLLSLPLFGQSIAPVRLPVGSWAATGGMHAAQPGSFLSIFENPAGFVREPRQLALASLAVNLSGPVLDIINAVPMLLGGGDFLGLLPGLLDAQGRLYVAADVAGPLYTGYAGNGLGFGFFNRSLFELNVASPFAARLAIREELVFAGGYARSFALNTSQRIDIGIMPKGFIRGEIQASGELTDLMDLLSAPDQLLGATDFVMTTGAGVDLGLSWVYEDQLALALVCRDALSPALVTSYSSFLDFFANASGAQLGSTAGLIRPDLSFGAFYHWQNQLFSRLGLSVELFFDYRDILNLFQPVPRHFLLNLGLGAGVSVLDILELRFGLSDALPAFGFGIDLGVLGIEMAMYGRELGLDPGQRPVYNLLFALSFVF